jgi:hypothetical protein
MGISTDILLLKSKVFSRARVGDIEIGRDKILTESIKVCKRGTRSNFRRLAEGKDKQILLDWTPVLYEFRQ